MGQSKADPAAVGAMMRMVCDALAGSAERPVIIGLCGAQGSGKSTLAEATVSQCRAVSISKHALSIDDLYLPLAERVELARSVHPLLATRGVPGTHEVALGLDLIAALRRSETVALPCFDKARDDRVPVEEWVHVARGCDVLILEGWCVGALPQDALQLAEPINALEAAEDAAGIWRKYANAALTGPYQHLFGQIDRLILLAAPAFEVVARWRLEQEQELARKAPEGGTFMEAPQIERFVAHYERLTRHILAEMPARADCLIELDGARKIIGISYGNFA